MRFKRFVTAAVGLVTGMFLLVILVLTFARMNVVVRGPGEVRPVRWAQITPQVGGLVVKKLKGYGDAVEEGEAIAILDSSAAQGKLAQMQEERKIRLQALEALKADVARVEQRVISAEAQLAQARVKLQQLKAESPEKLIANAREAVRQKEISLDQKRKEAKDTEELVAKGLVSELDLQRAKAARDIAESELAIEKNKTSMIEAQTKRDLELAEADVKRWESDLALARIDSDRSGDEKRLKSETEKINLQISELETLIAAHEIRSPMKGVIAELSLWEKEIVSISAGGGTSVGRVIDMSEFKFVAKVRQIDAPWVKPGQKAYIEIDAFPYRKCDVFEGEVKGVAPEARSAAGGAGAASSMTGLSGSTAPVEVEIRFVDPKWDIKPNYEGTAEIVVQQKARVIEWLLGLSKLELQSSKDAGRPAPSGGRGDGDPRGPKP